MNWADFLRIMVMEEKAAQAKYALAASQTDDPFLKDVFEKLQYEESVHADLLENEYNKWLKQQA